MIWKLGPSFTNADTGLGGKSAANWYVEYTKYLTQWFHTHLKKQNESYHNSPIGDNLSSDIYTFILKFLEIQNLLSHYLLPCMEEKLKPSKVPEVPKSAA